MKKFITLLLAILLMSCCLSFAVSAEGADFTISEDLQSLELNGVTYYRTDTSMVSVIQYEYLDKKPKLSAHQETLLRDVSFTLDHGKDIIEAEFYFPDGSTQYCSFVTDSFRQQLSKYLTDENTSCYIEFYWNDGPTTKAQSYRFKGSSTVLSGRVLENAEAYPVYVNNYDANYTIIKGTLLVVQDTFYYVDHQEANVHTPYCIDVYEYDTLDCYEITDPDLCADIEDKMGAYYTAAYGSGDFLGIASFVFWTFIFAVIPAAILVLAAILFFKGRGYYRYVWGATALCAILELMMYFVVITALLLSA